MSLITPIFTFFVSYPIFFKRFAISIAAIDRFIATYAQGSNQRELDALSKAIFNPTPDYADILAAQQQPGEDNNNGHSHEDELINSFIEHSRKQEQDALELQPAIVEQHVPAEQAKQAAHDAIEQSTLQDDSMLSESLAKMYIARGKYSKALEIIESINLNFPEKSIVTIKAIEIEDAMRIKNLDYGYDGPENGGNHIKYSYAHLHNLIELPVIWAEKDIKNAIHNKVIADLREEKGVYSIPTDANSDAAKGNYLLLTCTNTDKKIIDRYLALGNIKKGKFAEKCRFNYKLHPGKHSYLFRISTEYYWHIGQLNKAKINSYNGLRNITMKILEGD